MWKYQMCKPSRRFGVFEHPPTQGRIYQLYINAQRLMCLSRHYAFDKPWLDFGHSGSAAVPAASGWKRLGCWNTPARHAGAPGIGRNHAAKQASRLFSNFAFQDSGVLFQKVDEEHQKVSEVFEDGDRRDACPTPQSADKRLCFPAFKIKHSETHRHRSGNLLPVVDEWL